jgi:DNA-directed RNA polymerase specialized sigma24 family protein
MRLLRAAKKMAATGWREHKVDDRREDIEKRLRESLLAAPLPVPSGMVIERYWAPLARVGRSMGLGDVAAARAAGAALETALRKYEGADAGGFFSSLTLLLKDALARALEAESAREGADGLSGGALPPFESAWEMEWDRHLLNLALDRTRRLTDARQFEMFELYAVRRRTPAEIGKSHGVTAGNLYVMKHRISERVRQQLSSLRAELGFAN